MRRGLEKLRLRGEGRAKLVAFEKFLERADVLGLDGPGGGGWSVAARLWATASLNPPAFTFSDADLLVAATAAYHGRPFATADKALAEGASEGRIFHHCAARFDGVISRGNQVRP